MLSLLSTFSPMVSSSATCLDVKTLYQDSKCCESTSDTPIDGCDGAVKFTADHEEQIKRLERQASLNEERVFDQTVFMRPGQYIMPDPENTGRSHDELSKLLGADTIGGDGTGMKMMIFDSAPNPYLLDTVGGAYTGDPNRRERYRDFVAEIDISIDGANHTYPNDGGSHMAAVYFWASNTIPQAEFYLAKTEASNEESAREIDAMILAIEWAKEIKPHAITISLGYAPYFQDTDRMSSNEEWAAKRLELCTAFGTLFDEYGNGPLIFNSAGNSDKEGHIMGDEGGQGDSLPGVCDHVITIGNMNRWSSVGIEDVEQADAKSLGLYSRVRDTPELVCASYTLPEEAYDALPLAIKHPYSGRSWAGTGLETYGYLSSTGWRHATSWMSPTCASFVAKAYFASGLNTSTFTERLFESGNFHPAKTVSYGYGFPYLRRVLDPEVAKPVYGVYKELLEMQATRRRS